MNRRSFLNASVAGALASLLPAAALAAPSDDRFRVGGWGMLRRFLPTAFGRVAYIDAGSGAPALFLHGFPLSGFQWRGAVELLELDARCIVPDFLGLGMTEANPDQPLGPIAQMRMIVALLDGLGIDRAHVVGSDTGGVVGQLLAAHHPERVRSLLIANCETARVRTATARQATIALAREDVYVAQQIEPWYQNRDLARGREQFGGTGYADPAHPSDEAIELYFGPLLTSPERRRQVERHALAQASDALRDAMPLLRRNRTPARMVWGAADPIFDPSDAAFLDRAFPSSHGVRQVEGGRLFWPEERPDVIAEEALALWNAEQRVRA